MFHGYAKQCFGELHGSFVMCNHDDLRFRADDLHQVIKAYDVGFIQRCIDFIQQTEGCGADQEYGKYESDGG